MKRIDTQANELLPGPKALFVCGYRASDNETLLRLLAEAKIDCPLIWCNKDMAACKLGDILTMLQTEPHSTYEELPPVLLFSGVTMNEVQLFMALFKNAKLKKPIFATSTLHNLEFSVKELLLHLIREQMELARAAATMDQTGD